MRMRHQSLAWCPNQLDLALARGVYERNARRQLCRVFFYLSEVAAGHSLIEALRDNDCCRLFLIEWKFATERTKLCTIDSYLSDLNVAVDDVGPPVDLIGLCQGGWLSLVYAARFAGKVRRLVLAGAPVDVMAEPSLPSARATPDAVIDDIIRAGNGLVLGRTLLNLWPQEDDESAFVIDALQFPGPPINEKDRRSVASRSIVT
jgi:pimeloyl-ACP methyl ester carboxylesterase